jgi:hypothetical protein
MNLNGACALVVEGRQYQPERLIQPADVAGLVHCLLQLPRSCEATNIVLRPMLRS